MDTTSGPIAVIAQAMPWGVGGCRITLAFSDAPLAVRPLQRMVGCQHHGLTAVAITAGIGTSNWSPRG